MNRWLGTLFVGFTISAFALAGCGDDSGEEDGSDGGNQPTATTNTAVVGSIGTSTASLIASLSSAGDSTAGSAAAMSLIGIGQSGLSVITPSSGGGAQPQVAPELGTATFSTCDTECSGEGDSGSCTFSGCTDGTWSLEGSFSWGGGNLDADYTVSGAVSGTTYSLSFLADLTYTETSIDGTLSTDGESTVDANGQSYVSSWETSLVYDAVSWPAGGGCPTSGSISGSASVDVNGQGYSGDFDYTFDGTCQ